jgi:hypothetical protein
LQGLDAAGYGSGHFDLIGAAIGQFSNDAGQLLPPRMVRAASGSEVFENAPKAICLERGSVVLQPHNCA